MMRPSPRAREASASGIAEENLESSTTFPTLLEFDLSEQLLGARALG
jgi:hypothetical protein